MEMRRGRSSGKSREWGVETGRVRLGGGNGEGKGVSEKGEMGREQQEGGDGVGGKGEGEKKGQEERGFHRRI